MCFSLFPPVKDLLREHVVVTLFLTMLVGAGGNAGNQSTIKVRPPRWKAFSFRTSITRDLMSKKKDGY